MFILPINLLDLDFKLLYKLLVLRLEKNRTINY